MIATVVIAVLAGAIIGLFSGLLGIGGGSIMVPLFRLAFGMSAIGSTATSMFTIIPTSLSGTISHIRGKTCVPKLGVAMGLGGACTSPIGVWLASQSPSWAIMVASAIVIAYSATTMLRKALKAPKTPRKSKRSGVPDATSVLGGQGAKTVAPSATKTGDGVGGQAQETHPVPIDEEWVYPELGTKDLLVGALIGATAGVVSGYVGLGGGFLMIPMMLTLLHMTMKTASGTSLIAIVIIALPATIAQCMLGNVDLLVGIAIACGSIPGAMFGAKLTPLVPERKLRFMFAGFLGLASLLLVVNELVAL